MNHAAITQELSRNGDVFKQLLTDIRKEEYLWKSDAERWCLLEIVCHLYDEEREDFRARTKHVLDTPKAPLPSINPPVWVQERHYIKQNFDDVLNRFLEERKQSVLWLQSLESPQWNNAFDHPKFGEMSAKMFLSNWLAHDYLHIRQILKLKFDYLKAQTEETLTYAGEW